MRVAVIGLGLDGLIASWVLSQHPQFKVTVIGTPAPPTRLGSLPIVVHTPSSGNLLRELGVPNSSFKPRNGVLLRGEIQPWPEVLRKVSSEEGQRLRLDMETKAGRLPPNTAKLPAKSKEPSPRRLRCDFEELSTELRRTLNIVRVEDWRLLEDRVVCSPGRDVFYDAAIITAPLWDCRLRTYFDLPDGIATKRTVVLVAPHNAREYSAWDHVLTPYTPERCVYQVVAYGHGYAAEAAGSVAWNALLGDLNFLFPQGYEVLDSMHELHGEPYPLLTPATWPAKVAPLGRYTEWRSDITLDYVIDRSYDLLRRWARRR
jgi:hypothetical protein